MSKDWSGSPQSVFKTISATGHSLDGEREKHDYYATDPIAIDALFSMEHFSNYIWEPACGSGHLSERMALYGKQIYSSDKYEHGFGISGVDFLTQTTSPHEQADIITNPPYKFATEFVNKSLELSWMKVALFMKLTFLESAQRYRDIFIQNPPSKVYVFSSRILCAKNGDFLSAAKDGSAVAYAWYVWDKLRKNDPTTVHWFNPERSAWTPDGKKQLMLDLD